MGQSLLPSFRCQSVNGGSPENLERRMPREGIRKAVFPSTLLDLLPWSWDSWAHMPLCSSTCSFFGRGAWKGEEGDWWQQGSRGQFRAAPWKKTINGPAPWELKRLAWLGTQGALCFSSALLIHWRQPNMLSPNISGLTDRVLTLGFCLQSCQVLLWEILEKITLQTTFAPVFCEKV